MLLPGQKFPFVQMSQGRASRCSSKIAEGFGVAIKQVLLEINKRYF